MREELKQIEDEAEANPPPIFYDVCDGDSTDQAQIQVWILCTTAVVAHKAEISTLAMSQSYKIVCTN